MQVAPVSTIAVSLGRPNILRGAVRSDAVVAGATKTAFAVRARRTVRIVLDVKAILAPCWDLSDCGGRTLMNPPVGMSVRRGASQ